MQHWAVLSAEFGAPIHYIEGKRNIRADMLSRIRPREIDVVDTGSYVKPQTGTATWSLPLKFDGTNKEELSRDHQKELLTSGKRPRTQVMILTMCKVKHFTRARDRVPRQDQYLRVLLPRRWRDTVVDCCQ